MRLSSWILSAFAYIGVPAAVWYLIQSDIAAQRAAGHKFLCGNGSMGIIFLAFVLVSVLSIVATGLGVISLRSTPGPYHIARRIELAVLALPCALVLGCVAAIILSP